MSPRAAVRIWLIAAALGGALVPAHAGAAFETGVVGGFPGEHAEWFDDAAELGSGVARVNVYWSSVAPTAPSDPANPADPAYDFGAMDEFVREASARDLEVVATFLSAPTYAQQGSPAAGANAGTWKPNPAALGAFAQAVAARYSGGFEGLPRVRYFEAWNEANLDDYLAPQYKRKKLKSVGLYRNMVNSVARGIDAVNPDNRVVVGSLAPYGDEPGGSRTRPLTFLRELFCLNRKLKATGCPVKTTVDVLSHHPINLSGAPRGSAIDRDDASSADLDNVREVLRAAERQSTIAGGGKRHPLWVTEFWWNSAPPAPASSPAASPPATQARWIQEALYLFWRAGARVAVGFRIRDTGERQSGVGGTGLYFADGRPKPAFTAFRFPFVAERRSERKLFVWGRAPAAGELTIEQKRGAGWRKVAGESVAAGQVFTKSLRIAGSTKLRATVAGETSLVWAQRK